MIRNAELARAISEKFGLSAKEAENFVSTMIEIVNDALRYERQVKIKGLGTFKVLGVESRESVDVNTGRRITIGERDKISFTPDVTLRDRVNSPFAQFETFVINDDVDFSEIDARYASGENISVMPKDDEEDKPSDVVAAFVAPAPVAIEEEKPQEEPTIPNNKPEEIMYDEEFLRNNASQLNVQLNKLNDQLEANIERNNTVIKFLTALVVLLLLALGAGIYYFTHQLALRDNYIHQLETIAVGDSSVVASQENTQTALPDTTAKVAPQEKEPAAEKPAETQPKETAPAVAPAPAASAKAETPKPAEKPVEKKAEKPAEKVMSQYDSDPRIRLGAYDIVGTETTVTVQQGQTLQSISKAHLGPGMECYVEALNGVKTVKTGDKVKIPKLQLKKKKK